MIPTPAEVARRDAQRLALVLEEVGGAGEAIAGGWMACDLPGSWAHYAAGLGIERPLRDEDVSRLIQFYDSHHQPAEVQATPYQDESVLTVLAARGFTLHATECVLARSLTDALPPEPPAPSLRFVEVDARDPRDLERFTAVHFGGFYPDDDAPAGQRPVVDRVARHPRVTLWIVEHDGEAIASGGVEVHENSAVLIAGSVIPTCRRQGVQGALLHYRLQHAARLGLDYALVGSGPNGPTERNAVRVGFSPAYTQLALRRDRDS